MSKSSGEFLTLQALVDRGYHPLAFRLLCLQAHYRSELEFSWEGMDAALTKLKRLLIWFEQPVHSPGEGEVDTRENEYRHRFTEAICDDLNTPRALATLEDVATAPGFGSNWRRAIAAEMFGVLGLDFGTLTRFDIRIRPAVASITEPEIEAILIRRNEARAAKDFATSDALRDELAAHRVEVMDGDPLGWDWKLG